MLRFWAISKNTYAQTIRQPIFGLLILIVCAILILSVPLSAWTMGGGRGRHQETDQRMFENIGLSTLLLGGVLVAAFSASSALSREIEERTALTVIAKPVARATFVLGKFAGVAAAVTTAFYLTTLVYLLAVRHQVMSTASDPYDIPVLVLGITAASLALLAAAGGNYLFGWPFMSAFVLGLLVCLSVATGAVVFIAKGWQIVPPGHDLRDGELQLILRPQLLAAVLLMYLAVLPVVAVAVAASTRLGQILTLLICLGFLFVGTTHAFLFRGGGTEVPVLRTLGAAVPDLSVAFPWQFVGAAALTALAVGVALATRSRAAWPVAVALGLLAVGSAHPWLFRMHAEDAGLLAPLGWLVPDLAVFFPLDAVQTRRPFGTGYVALAVAYSLTYVGAAVAAGIVLFQSRQLEATRALGVTPSLVHLLAGAGRILALAVGVAALAVLPVGVFAHVRGLPLTAALLAAAVLLWTLWSAFGAGRRWAWWAAVLLHGAAAVRALVLLLAGDALGLPPVAAGPVTAQALLAGLVTLVLLLPKTRRHVQAAQTIAGERAATGRERALPPARP